MPAHLTLDIYQGKSLTETREFHRDIIKVGRLSSAHLRLEDEKVSRIHSVIEVSPLGEVSIIDMGSAVGTLVNGERINKSALVEGDEITVGGTRLVLHVIDLGLADEAPPGPSAPAVAVAVAVADVQAAAAAVAAADAGAGDATLAPPSVAAAAGAASPLPAAEGALAGTPPATPAFDPAGQAPAPLPVAAMPRSVLSAPGFAPAPEAAAPANEGEAFAPPGADATPPLPPEPEVFDPRAFVEAPGTAPEIESASVELRFMWGNVLLNVAHYQKRKKITVGEGKRCDFFLASDHLEAHEAFPLLTYDGQYHLAFTAQMSGVVRLGSEIFTLKELLQHKRAERHDTLDGVYTLTLSAESRAALDFGGITVLAHFVKKPSKIAIPWTDGLNYEYLNLFLFVMFMHLAMMITAFNFPYDTDLMADDLFKSPNRFAKFILKPPEPVKNERLAKLLESLKKSKPGEAAAKAKNDEGKMGRKNAKDQKTRSAPKAIDINSKDIIKSTGIFKMLKDGGSAGVSTIFGSGGLGGDLNGALGGLVGSSVGDARGVGGLGLRGTGGGGGGLSGNTYGVGGIGTKGRGGGLGGYGSGVGGLGKKKDSSIDISSGTPVIMGSLDKELIRRVIRSHLSQIRYCYERELQSKPGLYGKISIKFIISAMGAVTSAKVANTTMKNKTVEGCITSRVKTWQFPKPKGGGIVIVTYPFLFKPSG